MSICFFRVLLVAVLLSPLLSIAAQIREAPSFEANRGQFQKPFRFYSNNSSYRIAIADTGWRLISPDQSGHTVSFKLANYSGRGSVRGEKKLSGYIDYLRGRDSKKWITNVTRYSRLVQPNVFPGIDMVYRYTGDNVEYDYVVSSGADPSAIRFQILGATDLRIGAAGDLLVTTPFGEWRQAAPTVLLNAEKKAVGGRFVLLADNWVSIDSGAKKRRGSMTIDPVIQYSSYFGTSGDEVIRSIAYDGVGNRIVVGSTTKADSLVDVNTDAISSTSVTCKSDDYDIFVAKFDSSNNLIFKKIIGGCANDSGVAVTVSSVTNSIYLVGTTISNDFPIQAPVGYQPYSPDFHPSGELEELPDVIAMRLDSSGNLVYSTFLGGENADRPRAIVVDGNDTAYIVGNTQSQLFSGITCGSSGIGPFQCALASIGFNDGFFVALHATGSLVTAGSFIGGTRNEWLSGVGLSAGEVVIAGTTDSSDFPDKTGHVPFQNYHAGSEKNCGRAVAEENPDPCTDMFIARLAIDTSTSPQTVSLMASTYVGGDNDDHSEALAIGPNGDFYLVGTTLPQSAKVTGETTTTSNTNPLNGQGVETLFEAFPKKLEIKNRAGQVANLSPHVGFDAVVARLSPDLTNLVYASALGGIQPDVATSIAVVNDSLAYITGYTKSNDFFPLDNGFSRIPGESSVFVTRLDYNSSLPSLAAGFSTLLGGSKSDFATEIAVLAGSSPHEISIVGGTSSEMFPVTGADSLAGGVDGFLMKLTDADDASDVTHDLKVEFISGLPSTMLAGEIHNTSFRISNLGGTNITRYTFVVDFGRAFDLMTTNPVVSIGSLQCKRNETQLWCDRSTTLTAGGNDDFEISVRARFQSNTQITAALSMRDADLDMANNIAVTTTAISQKSTKRGGGDIWLVLAQVLLGFIFLLRKSLRNI